MLDFLGNTAATVIVLITVAGFLAIAGVFLFEVGTMLYFWIKHSLSDSSGEKMGELRRRPVMRRGHYWSKG